ncbi:hypothetical protein [Alkalihalophilus marmarensis]|uniref:hypothetical protein n=1 Tax=Alkalihalophilus marmarensis TaxID=521377 RepID=UPI002DBAAF8D|nr:hypothetical protein [Alkalihalophilus marmarensis]MEC2073344.1 hypothetical protein [Alkalihalophilus marmarensis]
MNMSQLVERITTFSKSMRKEVLKQFSHEKTHRIAVYHLAEAILTNKQTVKKTEEWLGLVFNEYRLTVGLIDFKLETKGTNNEKIMKLTAVENGKDLFCYEAYEPIQSEQDLHAVPQYVFDYLTKA